MVKDKEKGHISVNYIKNSKNNEEKGTKNQEKKNVKNMNTLIHRKKANNS